MAIRSGTGGLKYPLPSMYQIGAQQSAAAASSGGSASASAYGANRQFAANKMRVQADLANAAAERDFRARSQLEGQQFRAQQEFYDREHSKGAQLEQQDFMAGQQANRLASDFEMEQSQQAFQAQRDQFQAEVDQQAARRERVAKVEDAIQKGELELDPETEKKLQQLEQGKSYANDPNQFDPAQRDEFEQRYEATKEGLILSGARKPSGASVFNKGTIFVDEETGTGYNTPDAVPGKKLKPYNGQQRTPLIDTTKQDQQRQQAEQKQREADQKAKSDTSDYADEIAGKVKPGGGKWTPEEAYDEALKRRRARGLPTPEQAPAEPQQPSKSPAVNLGDLPKANVQSGQAPLGTLPEADVQTAVTDIRAEMKDVPIEEGKETPEMRAYFDANAEDILRYSNTPPEQVPEKSRAAVDFFGRVLRSGVSGTPIQLKTPEEALMLPPGTPYIDDQGNERTTKKKVG